MHTCFDKRNNRRIAKISEPDDELSLQSHIHMLEVGAPMQSSFQNFSVCSGNTDKTKLEQYELQWDSR